MPLSQLPSILSATDERGASTPEDTRDLDLEASDTFLTVKRWFTAARDASSKWREEAEDDYGFVAGHQWSEDDLQVLRDANRPVITFNRVGRVLDSVSGLEVGNRQDLRYIPRELGDVGVNELATAAADWIRDQCDAEDEESEAFFDLIVCGMGWTDTRMDYDEEPTGRVISGERIDPLEMFWDPASRKRNLSDARYRMRIRDIPLDEARSMFPDYDDDALHADWCDWTRTGGEPHDREAARNYRSGLFGESMPSPREDRTVRIVQVQWWEKEAYGLVADPDTQQLVEFPVDRLKAIQEKSPDFPGQVLHRKKFYQAFVGGEVLEEGDAPCPHFTLLCMTGKRDRNRNSWFGLVRSMKDPQRWANKWLSQVLHIINSNAKGGILVESDATADPQALEEKWAEPDSVIVLEPGAMAKVQQRPAPQLPAGIFQLMQFAIQSITDVPGINLELLGLADREQAGVLEHQRKQAGMTILATLFDSLRHYRKQAGRVLLYFIQEYVPEGTLIRISEEGQHKYVPLLKDQMTAEMDIIVDQAPSSPNNKELVWGLMQPLLPVILKIPNAMPAVAELIRYSPLPEAVSQKIIEAMQPKPQEGPSPEQLQAMLEQEKLKLQAQAQRVDAQLEAAKLADGKEARAQQAALEERKLQHEKEMKAVDILLQQMQGAREDQGKQRDQAFQAREAEAGRRAQAQDKQADRGERRQQAEGERQEREQDRVTATVDKAVATIEKAAERLAAAMEKEAAERAEARAEKAKGGEGGSGRG